MRTWIFAITVVSASIASCSKQAAENQAAVASAEATGSASAAVSARAVLALPSIGGTVAAVGDASVEVLVSRAGLVEAWVTRQGRAVTDGELTATVATSGGAKEVVALRFAPAFGRFQGRAKAGVELASGPVELALRTGGTNESGHVAFAAALEAPEFGGHVLTAGNFTAEVSAGVDGSVRARAKTAAGAALGADALLMATVRTAAGVDEQLRLSFDAPSACFVGKARAGVDFAPGPLSLSVQAGGAAGVGRLERLALSVAASHGGRVLAVGDYSVELVAKGGSVQAFVFDAAGKAVTRADLDLKLQLSASGGKAVALAWDAPSTSYKAALDGGLSVSAPLSLSLTASGKTFVGGMGAGSFEAALGGAGSAKASVGGGVGAPAVTAKAGSLVSPAARAAAGAKVSVTPPKIDVSAPKVTVKKSASATAGTKGTGAKASAGFSFGTK